MHLLQPTSHILAGQYRTEGTRTFDSYGHALIGGDYPSTVSRGLVDGAAFIPTVGTVDIADTALGTGIRTLRRVLSASKRIRDELGNSYPV